MIHAHVPPFGSRKKGSVAAPPADKPESVIISHIERHASPDGRGRADLMEAINDLWLLIDKEYPVE